MVLTVHAMDAFRTSSIAIFVDNFYLRLILFISDTKVNNRPTSTSTTKRKDKID